MARSRGHPEEAAFALAVVDVTRTSGLSYAELAEAARTYFARTGNGAPYIAATQRLDADLEYRAEMEQEHAKLTNRQN